ncbi:MAG TPA: histidinol-phosphate transaminase [Candidatus Brocadiia bacterium]|nr:histidinol-phosphate transaminase [Candidatus Brocadiales bacterium]
MSYFRDNIERMAGYQPGEQPKDGKYVKLNTNENPYPPSPKVIDAIKDAANSNLRLYPDPLATYVRENAANVFGTKPENVLVGNGSDDLLTIIIRSFAGPGDKVVYPYPTYMLYKTLAELQDAIACPIDFPDDYSLPNGISVKGAKVTFVANPNSPSGTIIPAGEISKLAEKMDGVLVLDEAYADFADSNCLTLVDKYPNILVLRTLSKSYSLAGLRLGFCIANEAIIQGMIKAKDSYNVDRLSMAAAIAALDDQETLKRNVAGIKETRAFLSNSLSEMGFFVYPSQSNFVFFRCSSVFAARQIMQKLKNRKILIRYFDIPKADDCLRVTVGTKEEIGCFLDNLRDIIKEEGLSKQVAVKRKKEAAALYKYEH